MTRPLLTVLALLALACGGGGSPTVEELLDGPEVEASPEAPRDPVFNRADFDGLPEGVTSWATYREVFDATEPAWAVILWGSTSEDEAWAWLERYVRAGGPVRRQSGYPYAVDSANIEGLKPGFWVIIAAEPDDKAVAEQILKTFQSMSVEGEDLSGAYLRQVRLPASEHELLPGEPFEQ